MFKKKTTEIGARRAPGSNTGPLKKGPFWAASKGRTNWRETAFSPCEAELNQPPRVPPRTPPGDPLQTGALTRRSTM